MPLNSSSGLCSQRNGEEETTLQWLEPYFTNWWTYIDSRTSKLTSLTSTRLSGCSPLPATLSTLLIRLTLSISWRPTLQTIARYSKHLCTCWCVYPALKFPNLVYLIACRRFKKMGFLLFFSLDVFLWWILITKLVKKSFVYELIVWFPGKGFLWYYKGSVRRWDLCSRWWEVEAAEKDGKLWVLCKSLEGLQ